MSDRKHSSTIRHYMRRSMHPKEQDGKGKRSAWVQAIAFLMCITVGILIVQQFRLVQKVGGSVSIQRTQELTNRVQTLVEENRSLQDQVLTQQERIREYEASFQDVDLVSRRLTEDLERARMEAGLVDMSGPGLQIVVSPRQVSSDEGFVLRGVMDEDLLVIVNELNASAAEAISINGQRIISITEIRSAGNYININTQHCASPFTILAIGDPTTLEAALKLRGGVAETLGAYYDIQITRMDAITVPKYDGIIQFRYAQSPTASAAP